MAAIEYGSYYWCVMLDGENSGERGDSIHLDADEISIERGTLIFKSAGRRPPALSLAATIPIKHPMVEMKGQKRV